MITAITPTGDRPLAFVLCQNWMKNQTLKADQWIVVDDGKTPMMPFTPMEYIRREPQPNDLQTTLHLNLKIATSFVKGDKIIIIEDDEYYAPDYIKEMASRLDKYEIVGICRSKYYHIISNGYTTHGNIGHASLAQTAFRSSFLPEFNGFLNNGPRFIDTQLWEKIKKPSSQLRGRIINQHSVKMIRAEIERAKNVLDGGRTLLFVDNDKPLYLGIKGLPGRPGIGIGHKGYNYHQFDSSDKRILKQWIPEDYQVYLDISNGKLTADNYQLYFG